MLFLIIKNIRRYNMTPKKLQNAMTDAVVVARVNLIT